MPALSGVADACLASSKGARQAHGDWISRACLRAAAHRVGHLVAGNAVAVAEFLKLLDVKPHHRQNSLSIPSANDDQRGRVIGRPLCRYVISEGE